jgi:hypothetical protein
MAKIVGLLPARLGISYETGARHGEALHLINLGLAAIQLERYQAEARKPARGRPPGPRNWRTAHSCFGYALFWHLLARAEGNLEQAELLGWPKPTRPGIVKTSAKCNLLLSDLPNRTTATRSPGARPTLVGTPPCPRWWRTHKIGDSFLESAELTIGNLLRQWGLKTGPGRILHRRPCRGPHHQRPRLVRLFCWAALWPTLTKPK